MGDTYHVHIHSTDLTALEAKLDTIISQQGAIMTLLDDTKAALGQLKQDQATLIADLTDAITRAQAAWQAAKAEIASLQAQIASGGVVSAADLQSVHDQAVQADQAITAADTSLKAATANLSPTA